MTLEWTEIADGLAFPEGPVALPDGSVLVVEIAAGCLTRIFPNGTRKTLATPGGGPNGAAIGPDGLCYVCNNGGFAWHHENGRIRPVARAEDYSGGRIERIDIETGAVEVLYDHCDGIPLKGPNDLVFDGKGGFWFTDLGKNYGRLSDRGAVYYARADGSLIREVVFPILTPNGCGLSPDGNTLYVAETETGRLWAFAIAGEGVLAKEPWPSPHGGRLVHGMGGYHRFDSMALEANGAICQATLVHDGIAVIAPTGALLEFHESPAAHCTNICFGGPDLRTAYVTISATGKLMQVPWPRPGLKLAY